MGGKMGRKGKHNPLIECAIAVILASTGADAQTALSPRAAAWWQDIAVIADDKTEGRQTGSPGYMIAADYVVSRFKALKLAPAGSQGSYLQQVGFEQQVVDLGASTASLIGPGGKETPLKVGETMLILANGGPRPAHIDAPLVFAGYGLHMPDRGYDDFKGLDVRGKIVAVIAGGPADLPGAAKAAARNGRAALLGKLGAIGLITLTSPAQVEIPWGRRQILAPMPGMYLADKSLRDMPDNMFYARFNPDQSELLFAGSGYSFAELAAIADASGKMPAFALRRRMKADIVAHRTQLASPNVVAKLEGDDPKLKSEYVVLSAHLDHLGIGAPIDGDRIYNGAMDDASGVASVLDIADQLAAGSRPKRSILFLIVTAEEKGLLGSQFFAQHPTVPKTAIVADLNLDAPLPLWPLKTVLVQGEHESTPGNVARDVAEQRGLRLIADPLPDRNSFTRTDQYSFVKAGIPALAFKFGFEKGTPAFQIENDWRISRYHAPSDDVNQPGIFKDEAVKFDDYVAAVTVALANDPTRPTWLPTSQFRSFAR